MRVKHVKCLDYSAKCWERSVDFALKLWRRMIARNNSPFCLMFVLIFIRSIYTDFPSFLVYLEKFLCFKSAISSISVIRWHMVDKRTSLFALSHTMNEKKTTYEQRNMDNFHFRWFRRDFSSIIMFCKFKEQMSVICHTNRSLKRNLNRKTRKRIPRNLFPLAKCGIFESLNKHAAYILRWNEMESNVRKCSFPLVFTEKRQISWTKRNRPRMLLTLVLRVIKCATTLCAVKITLNLSKIIVFYEKYRLLNYRSKLNDCINWNC